MTGYFTTNGEYVVITDETEALSRQIDTNAELREEIKELAEETAYLKKEVEMLKAEVANLHEAHVEDMKEKAELNAAMDGGTRYAVYITNDRGERQIATRRIDGTPFLTATAAAAWALGCMDLFPGYKYDWAPVRGMAS